jgi:small subunit ribosomal protein S20
MANNPSTEKRIVQNQRRRERNRSAKAEMRNSVKRLRAAVEAGDAQTAQELLPETLKIVDSSVRKSVIHRNTADRTKSRLVSAVRALSES